MVGQLGIADVDYYEVVVPQGQHLSLTAATHTQVDNANVCAMGVATRITIEDDEGRVLVTDTTGGAANCSLVGGFQLPTAGRFFVRVENFNAVVFLPNYFVTMTLE